MHTRKILYLSSLLILSAALSFTACKRDKATTNPTDTIEDTGYADDQAKMDQTFNEVENFSDEAATMGVVQLKGGSNALSGCASVTRDTVSVPHTITIDFGSSNCMCLDGRNRRGKIIITYSGHYRDSGSYHSITFDGYHVNNNYVYGSKTVTNMGHNGAGHSYYNITVDGHMVLNTTNDTISHVATKVRTWVAGESTSQLSDDEYEITGSGTMVRASGKTYSWVITQGLHLALNCNWIESGTIAITPQGATFARILNYGNTPNCDDQATITVNGHTRNITL